MRDVLGHRTGGGRWRAALVGLVAVVVIAPACSSGSDEGGTTRPTTATTTTRLAAGDAPRATLAGPITGGVTGVPFNSMPEGMAEQYDYSEQEYTASGTARRFGPAPGATWTADGRWKAAPTGETAPYRTRIVVRRPKDPKRFNGTVVVEWLNVSAGLDADPDFGLGHEELLRDGFAYVAVSAQKAGIDGGGGLIDIPGFDPPYLKQVDPERYGDLVHPGDDYSYDMFAQVAAALRRPGALDVLDGLVPQRIIADGESQSADRMATFVDAVQPVTHVFDGFLIHSRFAGGAQINRDVGAAQPGQMQIRTDLHQPVLQFETETDLFVLGFLPARQPDTDTVRTWEVAGTSHADRTVLDYGVASGQRSVPGANFDLAAACGRVNEGPQTYVVRAAYAALDRWIRTGTPPPSAPRLQVTHDAVQRDEYGNALGGIRSPAVDVPTVALSGERNAAGGIFCQIFGSTTPLGDAIVHGLYPTRDDYVAKVRAAADRAVEAGFLLRSDRDEIVAAARTDPALG
jgi:hypothetical protein